jgi:RNA polymerase sigma-70 factor (ECF subfamily)
VSQICKANDAVLFGVLYDRYENAVFNKCYGFVHSRDGADLTHDIFLFL